MRLGGSGSTWLVSRLEIWLARSVTSRIGRAIRRPITTVAAMATTQDAGSRPAHPSRKGSVARSSRLAGNQTPIVQGTSP